MTVTFDLPQELEQVLRREVGDLNQAAKEAILVQSYRQHAITLGQLARALNLSRVQADDLLKRYGVYYEITLEEIAAESASLGKGEQR